MLLIGLRLAHDFFRGETNLAGIERITDKEVVRELWVEICPLLEVGIFDLRLWQGDRLRYLLALKRR